MLYVKLHTRSQYASATGWADFANIVELGYKVTYKVDGEVYATDSLSAGEVFVPIAEPTKEGYTFSGWKDCPEVMPAHDVVVTSSFAINTYRVELTVGEGGTATVSNEAPEYGSSVVLTITPDTGYELATVLVNENDVTAQIANGSYTIEAIKADVKISVSFSVIVGIEQITTDAMPTDLYDLSGRKVQNARQGSFFVQNGKKLIVK